MSKVENMFGTRAQIIQTNALSIQVCIPADWTDEQATHFANTGHICGTTNGWQIRKAGDDLLAGARERVPCAERRGFVHVMLDA